jgi:hypothetical protein
MEDRAAMIVSGLSVVYDYAAPVSVGPSGEVTLPFDDLSLDMELKTAPCRARQHRLSRRDGGEHDRRDRSCPAMRGSSATAIWSATDFAA